jgi:hypothetical protein
LLAFAERDHLVENAAVLLQEKIFWLEIFDGGVEGVIIEENGAENGAFSVEILRQGAFESGLSGHKDSFSIRLFFAYSISPCGRQARFAELFSGAVRCRRNGCIVIAGGCDVNEKCCAKVFEGWKSLARDLIFGDGRQIEERFLASLGMTAQKKSG